MAGRGASRQLDVRNSLRQKNLAGLPNPYVALAHGIPHNSNRAPLFLDSRSKRDSISLIYIYGIIIYIYGARSSQQLCALGTRSERHTKFSAKAKPNLFDIQNIQKLKLSKKYERKRHTRYLPQPSHYHLPRYINTLSPANPFSSLIKTVTYRRILKLPVAVLKYPIYLLASSSNESFNANRCRNLPLVAYVQVAEGLPRRCCCGRHCGNDGRYSRYATALE